MSQLEWSASDDGEDRGCWEGMASARSSADLAAAREEAQALLARAKREAPGARGPEEEGGLWDADLSEQAEAGGWFSLTLTLTGPLDWGERLLASA